MKTKNFNRILTIFFLLLNTILCAQDTSLEDKIINEYQSDSLTYDFIAGLSVIDSTVTQVQIEKYKDLLGSFTQNIPSKESKSKKEKKRIERIYDEAHKQFFKKYEEIATFSQIFDTGVYNCVTATALYAYIFDKIQVPYAIKDAPGHVYLIAYPKTHKIVLETTAPGSYGFRIPKDSEVKDQVNQLLELKLVTESEVAQKGVSKVFMDYFYGEEKLSKAALIGMQYYNTSLVYLQNEDHKKALDQIQKSLVFFPYKPSEFLYVGLIGIALSEMELNTEENITYLKDILNTPTLGDEFTKRDIQHYVFLITQHDDNDLKFIEQAASILQQIKNQEIKITSQEILYEYMARKNADIFENEKAIIASDSILVYNPKSKIAKEIITYSVGRLMSKATNSQESIDEMQAFYQKYNFLNGSIKIESLRAIQYGRMAQKAFIEKDPDRAKGFLKNFEQILDIYGKRLEINPDAHAMLYLQAGRFYYGKLKNKQALQLFEKGLTYNPGHTELKKMVRWVKEDMN